MSGQHRVHIITHTAYHNNSGNPTEAKTCAEEAHKSYKAWCFDNRNRVKILRTEFHTDSKAHGNPAWHGAVVTTVVVHFEDLRFPVRLDKSSLGPRRVKVFAAAGYNDATGNPCQAVTTAGSAEQLCDAWLDEMKDRIIVADIDVLVDSKQHGQQGWNGACVASIAVHFFDREDEPRRAEMLPHAWGRRLHSVVKTIYYNNSGTPGCLAPIAEASAETDQWITDHRADADVLRVDVSIDSKSHGHHQWNGACVVVFAIHYVWRRDIPRRSGTRGMKLMKPFVATGYNDGSGNPVQAIATVAAVEAEFDTWLQQQADFVSVDDIEIAVDSHNRGPAAWNGSCVATLAVHYTETTPDSLQATAPPQELVEKHQ
jgi:hypothetical protein